MKLLRLLGITLCYLTHRLSYSPIISVPPPSPLTASWTMPTDSKRPTECQCSSFACIISSVPRRTSARNASNSSANSSGSGVAPRSSNVSATPLATWRWRPRASSSAHQWVHPTAWTRLRCRYQGEFASTNHLSCVPRGGGDSKSLPTCVCVCAKITLLLLQQQQQQQHTPACNWRTFASQLPVIVFLYHHPWGTATAAHTRQQFRNSVSHTHSWVCEVCVRAIPLAHVTYILLCHYSFV